MSDQNLDWSKLDNCPESICFCRCGTKYNSHIIYIRVVGIITRKSCPGCGQTNKIRKVSYMPETVAAQ
jgi:hypothetical protein